MEKLVESIVARSDFPEILEELKAAWEEEKRNRSEFLKQVKEGDKAEFINGEPIFWNSPVKLTHLKTSNKLANLLISYSSQEKHQGLVAIEKAMIQLGRNLYEPDICYWPAEIAVTFTDDQMLFPAPIFIAEILSDSTKKNDRGVKFQEYARGGIAEYWIIDPENRTVEQYKNQNGQYALVTELRIGELESFSIPGFQISVEGLFI